MATPESHLPPITPRGFGTTWQRVVTDPKGFFAEMPEAGGLGEPLVFLAICAGLGALGNLVVGLNVGAAAMTVVSQVVGALLVAALFVLIAQHLFDGRAGFEPTFRAVAYAAAPLVFAWIPRLGAVAVVYSWFLMVRGLERVQSFDATRAVMTVAIGIAVAAFAFVSIAGGFLLAGLR
ncbi:MAG: YIP1 family protein [Candidatus Binatia bacterium]